MARRCGGASVHPLSPVRGAPLPTPARPRYPQRVPGCCNARPYFVAQRARSGQRAHRCPPTPALLLTPPLPCPAPARQGAFDLSNTQDGLLATAFLVGLLAASPLFSEACKHVSAFKLLAVGMGTWALAVLGCGLAFNFESILVCRMLVGVGEASFIALAVPFIGAAARRRSCRRAAAPAPSGPAAHAPGLLACAPACACACACAHQRHACKHTRAPRPPAGGARVP